MKFDDSKVDAERFFEQIAELIDSCERVSITITKTEDGKLNLLCEVEGLEVSK